MKDTRLLPILAGAAIVIFTICGLLVIDRPGLYMDAVNPDYQVVVAFNPSAPVTNWSMPGNFIFGRFPVLEGLYTGSYTFYWALPFFLLFGGTILSVRIAHLCIGIVVLACVAALGFSVTRSRILTGVTVLVLALDPAFIYVFRTQGYVVLFPVVFLLLSLLVLARKSSVRGYLLAGLFAGMSSFGYFVYFFALPGLLVFAARDPLVTKRAQTIGAFVAGYVVGASPFVLGYGLILEALGIQGGVSWIASIVGQFHIDSGDNSYAGRVLAVGGQIWRVLDNEWEWRSFWAQPYADPGQSIKAWVLVALPCIAALFARRRVPEDRGFGLVALTVLSYVLVATVFGKRLGGHEFNMLVPMFYVLAAASVALLIRRSSGTAVRRVAGAAAAVALVLNAFGTFAVASKLQKDGAVGYWSSVITQYPESVVASHDTSPHIFLDWGAMMPFIYETGGKVPAFDGSTIANVMCQYGNAKLVVIGNDVDSDIVPTTIRQNDMVEGPVQSIEDPDSRFVYEVVSVTPRHNPCGAGQAAPQVAATPPSEPVVADAASLPSSYDFRHGMSAGLPSGVFWGADASTCCFIGAQAAFPLRMRHGVATVEVTVYQPSFTPGPGTLAIDFGDGTTSSTFTVARGELRTLSVPLPNDIKTRRSLEVRLRDFSTFVPKDQGINGDTRTLGLIVRDVRLQ